MMGWEGVFGLLITVLILIPAQFLGCPFRDDQCVNSHIDDLALAYQQVREDTNLIILAAGFVCAAALFNALGAFTTKNTSAANRSVIEQMRVIVVWSFFLLNPGIGHEIFHP